MRRTLKRSKTEKRKIGKWQQVWLTAAIFAEEEEEENEDILMMEEEERGEENI